MANIGSPPARDFLGQPPFLPESPRLLPTPNSQLLFRFQLPSRYLLHKQSLQAPSITQTPPLTSGPAHLLTSLGSVRPHPPTGPAASGPTHLQAPAASGPAHPRAPPGSIRPHSPGSSRRALTVAALAPVVRGEAVVALGPRRTLAALAEAGLVAPVVHGADLVAVTLWTDSRTASDQGDLWALSARTHPARPRHPPRRISASAAGRWGEGCLGCPDRERRRHFLPSRQPLPLFLALALWPGPALSALWARLPASVTGAGADPPQLQRAVTDRWAGPHRGHLTSDLRAVLCVGTGRCSGHPQLSSRASSLTLPLPSRFPGASAPWGRQTPPLWVSLLGRGWRQQAKKKEVLGGGEDRL